MAHGAGVGGLKPAGPPGANGEAAAAMARKWTAPPGGQGGVPRMEEPALG